MANGPVYITKAIHYCSDCPDAEFKDGWMKDWWYCGKDPGRKIEYLEDSFPDWCPRLKGDFREDN